MMLFARVVTYVIFATIPLFANAGQREDVGYTKLQDRLGDNTPTGKGINVSAYEPEFIDYSGSTSPKGWMPFSNSKNLNHINTIEMYQGQSLATKSGNTSSHANTVSKFMFGKEQGVSQELESVSFHFLDHFIQYLLYPRTHYQATYPVYPYTVFENQVNNFSATSSFSPNNKNFLRRFDWATAREDVVNIVSSGNNQYTNASAVFSSSLNGIYVGITSLWHSRYSTEYHYSRQNRPDIVAPNVNTSRGTGTITGITAVLMETAKNDELSELGVSEAGSLILNAERSETMKAILMAGADRTTFNTRNNGVPREIDGTQKKDEDGQDLPSYTANIDNYRSNPKHQTSNGLDTRYGAGQANVETSYDILMGKEQASLEDDGEQTVSLMGFDYDDTFGLGVKNQIANSTATYVLPTLEVDSDIAITLAWNADVASYNGIFSAVAVYDLDLWLFQIIDNEEALIASSTSNSANTENIWAELEAEGNYFFRVNTTKNLIALVWDYAIAWNVTEKHSMQNLNMKAASVPIPSSILLFVSALSMFFLKKHR